MPVTAKFPTTVWDASSASRIPTADQTAVGIHADPDAGDWDRVVAEVIAIETGLTVTGLTAVVPSQVYKPINAQVGTEYTLAESDAGKRVTFTNAASIALTVPANTLAAIPVGASVNLSQLGAGQVTIAAADGVAIVSYFSLVAIAGQYATAVLTKTATDTWLLEGNLA